jgi:hypothetical protein
MRRLTLLYVLLSTCFLLLHLTACASPSPVDTASNAATNPVAWASSGSTPSCSTPQTGCPCGDDGALVACGEVHGTTAAGTPNCEYGYRRCESGAWSACAQLQNITPLTIQGLNVSPPVEVSGDAGCSGDPCDPYCESFPPSALPDGGVTVPLPEAGSGQTALQILADAGIALDAGIYHTMIPGQLAFDPVNTTTTLSPVDVYFLFNSTSEMYPAFSQLETQIPSVVNSIESAIPNTAFGLGRFTNYASWPYADQQSANTVYANLLPVTTDTNAVANAFNGVGSGSFPDKPYVVAQSSGVALYDMALNQDLGSWAAFPIWYPGTVDPNDYWYAVDKYWGRSAQAEWFGNFYQSQPCAAGTVGAPCFRSNAFHLVLLIQDSPMMNGPAGSFPYYQFMPRYFPTVSWADYTTENSWYWWDVDAPLQGGTASAPQQVISIPAASVGQSQTWMGSAYNNASNYRITQTTAYDPSATMKCTWNGQDLGTGPDAEFDFTVAAGAPQRFWFDTVGSAYDTILYVIDQSSGLLMACSDDNFAWLSAGGIGVPGEEIAQYNSAVVGTLPPGNYRLVLDSNPTQAQFPTDVNPLFYAGYQLNLWPDHTDPMESGPGTPTNHSAEASTPGYAQMLNALATPGINAKVGGIDMSGSTCGQSVTAWENQFTRWSLEGLAEDTGAVANGQPIVVSVRQDGTPGPVSGSNPGCPSASNLGAVVSNAIAQLTNNEAQPITAVAVDFDDATDYDGPPGGPLLLTPYNVDDATFVQSIVAQPVPGCTGPSANGYASCLPGAQPTFQITFALPTQPVAVTQSTVDQIFYFKIYIYGQNQATPLTTTPVVIVVPALPPATTVDVYQDYSASCPSGMAPQWGIFNWNSVTPSDSSIAFSAAFAPNCGNGTGGIAQVADITPAFTSARASPNSQVGAFDLGAYAKTLGVPGSDACARIHAQLSTSSDGTQAPTLDSIALQVDCVPSE